MIKDELDKWDEPFANSSLGGSGGYTSRAASPPASSPQQYRVAEKKPWLQQ